MSGWRTGTRILRSCAVLHCVFATRSVVTLLEFGKVRHGYGVPWIFAIKPRYIAGSHSQCRSDCGFFQSTKAHGWESTNRGYQLCTEVGDTALSLGRGERPYALPFSSTMDYGQPTTDNGQSSC
jgi:hypothetical protein